MDKKEAHAEYLKRWKASGGKTREFKCPLCESELEHKVPKRAGEVWTSAMGCPECDGHIFLVVPHSGPIEVESIND